MVPKPVRQETNAGSEFRLAVSFALAHIPAPRNAATQTDRAKQLEPGEADPAKGVAAD
jgi:hypothetical protein